ncbi:Partner of Y14 and mago [Sesamum angolense]|uniref:Partner of Y14 and mago n=1 Tax=Sesamum angolense TaxID=2727404 RepID=A0AAE2BYA3_9LAMI|nr:Partner of Y14 and mago [Sesamum angolense]
MESGANGGAEDVKHLAAELGKTLKEGERILAPTRRPDGTLRKPIRIRAGYVPQDEVAIYQSKGSLWRKEMAATQEVPPGYDPVVEAKPKSKSAKRNERKKRSVSRSGGILIRQLMELRVAPYGICFLPWKGVFRFLVRMTLFMAIHLPYFDLVNQKAAHDKGKSSEQNDLTSADGSSYLPENLESISSKMNGLSLSGSASLVTPPSDSTECSAPVDQVQDIDKKIRALKKKIRLTEAQQQKGAEKDLKPEQLEKVAKLEGWRNELKLLEEKKAELTASLS